MREPLFLSFIIGFIAASPVGPIGLLCMRRAIIQGFTSGIISASGISCAYAFWAYVTIHGLATFSYWIDRERHPLEIAIGLFFVIYGLHTIFNNPNIECPTLKRKGRFTHFLSTFLVVFLNPATFILFAVLFTLIGVAKGNFGLFDSVGIAIFIFLGAITFEIMASYSIQQIKDRTDDFVFIKISIISSFMMAFGITISGYP